MLEVSPRHLAALGFANICLFALSTFTVALRLYVRAAITRTFAMDDWLLMAAQLIVIIGVPPFMIMEKHLADYPPRSQELYENLSNLFWISASTYVVASALFKMSLALFFLKLAQKSWQRVLIISTATTYTIIVILYFLLSVLQCGVPIPHDMLMREDCPIGWSALEPMSYVLASASGLSDWIFAITPVFLVLKARRMKRSSRVSVCLLVGLAVMGSIVSIIRVFFVPGLQLGPDFLVTQSLPSQLCFTETAIGIMAVSLATLKPLFQRIRNKVVPSRRCSPSDEDLEARAAPCRSGSAVPDREPSFNATFLQGLGLLPNPDRPTFISFLSRASLMKTTLGDQKAPAVSVTEVQPCNGGLEDFDFEFSKQRSKESMSSLSSSL